MRSNITFYIFVILTIILIAILIYNLCNYPIVYIYDSLIPGPNIVFISATHGNELAPHYAIFEYLAQNKPIKGKITHISVNRCGILFNNREQGPFDVNKDINRNYGKNNNINKEIVKHIKHADLIIDFHESLKFLILKYQNNFRIK